MSFSDWLSNAAWYYRRQDPVTATKITGSELATGAMRRIYPRLPRLGTPIYDREWDVLVVLDTCRPDALDEVAPEYEYLPDSVSRSMTALSLGTNSREWMEQNFVKPCPDEVRETAHVTFNPNTAGLVDHLDWLLLDEVWRTGWDADSGGVSPRTITDHTIAAHRELDPEWTIAHYQQPHTPYPNFEHLDFGRNELDDDANDRSGTFGALIRGDITREQAWEGYLDNLRLALDDLEVLLSNLAADRVIITADHGECFGEWGIYGHHKATPVPELIRVPWVPVSGTDERTHEPDVNQTVPEDDTSLDEKLSALGYK